MVAPASPLLFGTPPIPRARLIGRESERVVARSYILDDVVPLLMFTGPGGVGKTRLALQIAADVAPGFRDGAALITLATVRETGLVLPTIARTLGVLEGAQMGAQDALTRALRDQQLLLVLDNLEHVVGVGPALVVLLEACPELQMLTTSRVPLHVRGEQVLRITPLPTPEPEIPFERLMSSAAVELFAERGRQTYPAFAVTPENAETVAQIVKRLDGLPLAIELAAARLSMLSPAALLARLDQRLRILTGGASDLPPRLRSMEDAIGWSYDLLDSRQQELFRRLAVFVGGFDLDAAASLTKDDPATVLDNVQGLVEQSLAQRLEAQTGTVWPDMPSRFGMLETIREFAQDRLVASHHEAILRDAHAAYFLSWAESARTHLDRLQAGYWSQRFENELGNLRSALNWLLTTGDGPAMLRLAVAVSGFFFWQGHLREGRDWLTRALEFCPEPNVLRARALVELGNFVHALGDYPRSMELGSVALAIADDAGDARVQALALHLLALTKELLLRFDAARPLYEAELALLYETGEFGQAAWVLSLLGGLAYGQDDLDRAEGLLNESLELSRDVGSPRWLATSHWYLGLVMSRRGRLPDAARSYRESLTLYAASGVQWWLSKPLAGLAAIAAMDGQAEGAASLLGAAEAIWERSSAPVLPFDQPNLDRAREGARASLGEQAFAAAYARGQAMTPTEVHALADNVTSIIVAPRRRLRNPNQLTRREGDILRLLAQGLTDQEIATAFSLSRKTVSNHVAAILAKLGVRTRTAAAARASEFTTR